jgi:hypothetical protein
MPYWFTGFQAADRDRDAVLDDIAEEQGRAAVAAEAALDELGALERARLAFGPAQIRERHAGERREVVAEGFLAHAAMSRGEA